MNIHERATVCHSFGSLSVHSRCSLWKIFIWKKSYTCHGSFSGQHTSSFQFEWPKKNGAAIFVGSKLSVNNEMHLKAFSCCDKICSTEMRFAGRSGSGEPFEINVRA